MPIFTVAPLLHAHAQCLVLPCPALLCSVGTPDYMAPELLGNGSVDTLYHRRTGK